MSAPIGEGPQSLAPYELDDATLLAAFPVADGYRLSEESYRQWYPEVITPHGGTIRIETDDKFGHFILDVAAEIGSVLPKNGGVVVENHGNVAQYRLWHVNDEVLKTLNCIPGANGGIQRNRGGAYLFNVDGDNIGARYELPDSLVLGTEGGASTQPEDNEALKLVGLDETLTNLAAEYYSSWENVDETNLVVSTVMKPYLIDGVAGVSYRTGLSMSRDGGTGYDTINFEYDEEKAKLRTPFDEPVGEKSLSRLGGTNKPRKKVVPLTAAQNYVLQSISRRNRLQTHTRSYQELLWLAELDPTAQDTFAAMKEQEVIPGYELGKDDLLVMKDVGLLDGLVRAVAQVNDGWANALEEDRAISLSPKVAVHIDPASGELMMKKTTQLRLVGWQPVYATAPGSDHEEIAGKANLNTICIYDPEKDIIQVLDWNEEYTGRNEGAWLKPTPPQASVISALASRSDAYLTGALMEQLAKGQPKARAS